MASVQTNPAQPVRLTADLIVYGDAPATFTSTDAYGLFQNWQFWLQQGYLDGGMPMNYKMEHCTSQDTMVPQLGRPGGELEIQPPHVHGPGQLSQQQGEQPRPDAVCPVNGCEGVASYSYYTHGHQQPGLFGLQTRSTIPVSTPYVRDNLFTDVVGTPTMPWRYPATATEGTLWGRVTDPSGNPVDDAIGPGRRSADRSTRTAAATTSPR